MELLLVLLTLAARQLQISYTPLCFNRQWANFFGARIKTECDKNKEEKKPDYNSQPRPGWVSLFERAELLFHVRNVVKWLFCYARADTIAIRGRRGYRKLHFK